jgi:hypothetical protein
VLCLCLFLPFPFVGEFSVCVVDVEILEARDLIAMDGRSSDPYCVCSHNGLSYKTPVVMHVD